MMRGLDCYVAMVAVPQSRYSRILTGLKKDWDILLILALFEVPLITLGAALIYLFFNPM